MKLLLDVMLSPAVAKNLRVRGIDTVAVVDVPVLVAAADEDLLGHAAESDRAIVTMNIADFAIIAARWRAAGREHAGIIYVAYRAFPQTRAFVGAVTRALAAPALVGAVRVEREVFLRPLTGGR